MTIATGTPVWADLQSLDREAAHAFYGAVFGWTFEVTGEEFGHYANATLDGAVVAGEMKAPQEGPQVAYWSLYLKTDSAADAVSRATGLGAETLVEPMSVGELGTMAVMKDPGCAAFGVWEPKAHQGFAISGAHGHPCWFEVNTGDAHATANFYAEIGGGLEVQKMEGMDYWTVHADGRPRFGAMQMTDEWKDIPPHWMIYFAVDDVDATAAQVVELGGAIHHGPFDTPFGRIAVARDPQGAVFTVITMANP